MEVFILFLLLFIASIPAFIASSKGRAFFTWFIYGLFLFPFAFIHAIVIKPNELAEGMKKCPSCSTVISIDASICPACRTNFSKIIKDDNGEVRIAKDTQEYKGERSISSSSYQLYLTRKYSIERNETLQKFIINDQVYDTLEAALSEANRIEEESINRDLDSQRLANEKLQKEQEEKERAAALRIEEEIRLAPIRAAQKKQNKKIAIILAALVIAIISIYKYIAYENTRSEEIAEKLQIEAEKTRGLEISKRINPLLADMFLKHEFFGFKIGVNTFTDLQDKVKVDGLVYKKDPLAPHQLHRITYGTTDVKKIISDQEMASQIIDLMFIFCRNTDKKSNPYNMELQDHFILNGVVMTLASHDQAKNLSEILIPIKDKIIDPTSKYYKLETISGSNLGSSVGLYRTIKSDSIYTPNADVCIK